MTTTQTRVHIRWMIRRDMPEVLAIEAVSFDDPWSEADFLRALRQRKCIGMVAEHGDRIVGFMIYELRRPTIVVLNFATHPGYRQQGIGHQMAAKLIDKLTGYRHTRLTLTIRESNLAGQCFFRAQGFRATQVIQGVTEDLYAMEYRFQ